MSSTSRRSFLATTGALIAAAAATPLEAVRPPLISEPHAPTGPGGHNPANTWIGNQPQYQTVALYQFTPQSFQPLVGTNFKVTDSQGHRLTLRLMTVSDLSKQCPGSKSAFGLRFQVVAGKPLGQGTYQFYTTTLGTFLLFVVPSIMTSHTTYTAVINRV